MSAARRRRPNPATLTAVPAAAVGAILASAALDGIAWPVAAILVLAVTTAAVAVPLVSARLRREVRRRVLAAEETYQLPVVKREGTLYQKPHELDDGLRMRMLAELSRDDIP